MRILIFTLLITYASANLGVQEALDGGLHPFSSQMVQIINNNAKTWRARHHFTENDFEDVKSKMGTILNLDIELPPVNESTHFDLSADIPEEFDSRVAFPKCEAIISDIRDQANCGSCWAVAAAGAISDRTCIASDGKLQVKISANDLLSCCNLFSTRSFCGYGCNGGMISLAWRFWVKKGLVSGGNFGENDTCSPYKFQPCGHHTDKSPPCKGMAKTPKCQKSCVNSADYNHDKHYGARSYSLRGEQAIQRDIMQHGSVEAGFTVYSDFPQYEDGVYVPTSHSPLGGHAIRIIGWGVDKTNEVSLKYWLIANSWNSDWGQKGYFKMIRGINSCGIESQVSAGLPKV